MANISYVINYNELQTSFLTGLTMNATFFISVLLRRSIRISALSNNGWQMIRIFCTCFWNWRIAFHIFDQKLFNRRNTLSIYEKSISGKGESKFNNIYSEIIVNGPDWNSCQMKTNGQNGKSCNKFPFYLLLPQWNYIEICVLY